MADVGLRSLGVVYNVAPTHMDRIHMLTRLSLSVFGIAALVVACGSDDSGGTSALIRNFCASYSASPTFSCCTADDRENSNFGLRYRFASQASCVDSLSQQASQAEGRQGFNNDAASSCLSFLNSRACGTLPLADARKAEQAAGCYKILSGIQKEGQNCIASDDCEPGLVCPTIKETGLSFCAKPATTNQDCIGAQAESADHPACAEGLFCQFISENPAGCPSPPCLIYKCVPPFEEGDPCSGTECATGLVCKDATCQKGAPNGAGGSCRIAEHCAEGLYCDGNTVTTPGTCVARKASGEACTVANNTLYECKGICAGGTCAGFCGQ